MKASIAMIVLLVVAGMAPGQVKSVYTDLSETKCKTLELNEEEGGFYKGECAGIGGYKLHVIDGDLRQTINVISPEGESHELRFWEFFGGFSAVGPRAEWRTKGGKPIGLIIRLNVSEDPERPESTTSYLMVARIGGRKICITNIITPSRSQNILARDAADRAASLPCRPLR